MPIKYFMVYYIKLAFKRFRDFKGVASKKEFWVFFIYCFVLIHLFLVPGMLLLYIQIKADLAAIDMGKAVLPLSETAPAVPFLMSIAFLLMLTHLIPLLAVSVRRLHDIQKSAKWLLLLLIPMLGPIFLLILMAGEKKLER